MNMALFQQVMAAQMQHQGADPRFLPFAPYPPPVATSSGELGHINGLQTYHYPQEYQYQPQDASYPPEPQTSPPPLPPPPSPMDKGKAPQRPTKKRRVQEPKSTVEVMHTTTYEAEITAEPDTMFDDDLDGDVLGRNMA